MMRHPESDKTHFPTHSMGIKTGMGSQFRE